MSDRPSDVGGTALVETVVKIGGGLLAYGDHFRAVLGAITVAARERRLLVVPGGGPFADVVREVDRRFQLSDDAAHWMAVLAMDQYAHVVADRLVGGVLVAEAHDIFAALGADAERKIPVLAPCHWLHESDPLPHTWDVTSDSIAAWVAGEVGAQRLVLVKPPGARLRGSPRPEGKGSGEAAEDAGSRPLVDAYFARALPSHVTPVIVAADQTDALRAALRGGTS